MSRTFSADCFFGAGYLGLRCASPQAITFGAFSPEAARHMFSTRCFGPTQLCYKLSRKAIGASIGIYREVGPQLLENACDFSLLGASVVHVQLGLDDAIPGTRCV